MADYHLNFLWAIKSMPLADVSNTEWRPTRSLVGYSPVTMPLADVSNTEWRKYGWYTCEA